MAACDGGVSYHTRVGHRSQPPHPTPPHPLPLMSLIVHLCSPSAAVRTGFRQRLIVGRGLISTADKILAVFTRTHISALRPLCRLSALCGAVICARLRHSVRLIIFLQVKFREILALVSCCESVRSSEQHDVWLKQLNVTLAASDRSAAMRGTFIRSDWSVDFFHKMSRSSDSICASSHINGFRTGKKSESKKKKKNNIRFQRLDNARFFFFFILQKKWFILTFPSCQRAAEARAEGQQLSLAEM